MMNESQLHFIYYAMQPDDPRCTCKNCTSKKEKEMITSSKLNKEMAVELAKQIEDVLTEYGTDLVQRRNEDVYFIAISKKGTYTCLLTIDSFSNWYEVEKFCLNYARGEAARAQDKDVEYERVKEEAMKFVETSNQKG